MLSIFPSHRVSAAVPTRIDEEHLAADLIEQVGIGKHYLKRPETLAALRKEYVRVWPPTGRDILDLVHGEAREILENHRPSPFPRVHAKGCGRSQARQAENWLPRRATGAEFGRPFLTRVGRNGTRFCSHAPHLLTVIFPYICRNACDPERAEPRFNASWCTQGWLGACLKR